MGPIRGNISYSAGRCRAHLPFIGLVTVVRLGPLINDWISLADFRTGRFSDSQTLSIVSAGD